MSVHLTEKEVHDAETAYKDEIEHEVHHYMEMHEGHAPEGDDLKHLEELAAEHSIAKLEEAGMPHENAVEAIKLAVEHSGGTPILSPTAGHHNESKVGVHGFAGVKSDGKFVVEGLATIKGDGQGNDWQIQAEVSDKVPSGAKETETEVKHDHHHEKEYDVDHAKDHSGSSMHAFMNVRKNFFLSENGAYTTSLYAEGKLEQSHGHLTGSVGFGISEIKEGVGSYYLGVEKNVISDAFNVKAGGVANNIFNTKVDLQGNVSYNVPDQVVQATAMLNKQITNTIGVAAVGTYDNEHGFSGGGAITFNIGGGH